MSGSGLVSKRGKKQSDQVGGAAHRLRRFAVGAEVKPGGGVDFRVWAPKSKRVSVLLSSQLSFRDGKLEEVELHAEDKGYFARQIAEAHPRMFYKFRLDDGSYPDPASRFQPEGPHGPSQIVDPGQFAWTDKNWGGVPRDGQVIYEL